MWEGALSAAFSGTSLTLWASKPFTNMSVPHLIPLITLILMTGAFGCTRQSNIDRSQANVASSRTNYKTELYATLSTVISNMYVDDHTHLLVIQGADPCPSPQPVATPNAKVEEMRKGIEDYAFQRMPELAPETINDFHARSKECHPHENKLDVPIEYVIVGFKDLAPLFPKGGFDRFWRRFYAKYPQSSGIITFSNPGFNRDYTQAVLSTGRMCGGLCGVGHFVLLTKEHGVWKVKTKVETWVS